MRRVRVERASDYGDWAAICYCGRAFMGDTHADAMALADWHLSEAHHVTPQARKWVRELVAEAVEAGASERRRYNPGGRVY